jgi:hypothetical protein
MWPPGGALSSFRSRAVRVNVADNPRNVAWNARKKEG